LERKKITKTKKVWKLKTEVGGEGKTGKKIGPTPYKESGTQERGEKGSELGKVAVGASEMGLYRGGEKKENLTGRKPPQFLGGGGGGGGGVKQGKVLLERTTRGGGVEKPVKGV